MFVHEEFGSQPPNVLVIFHDVYGCVGGIFLELLTANSFGEIQLSLFLDVFRDVGLE